MGPYCQYPQAGVGSPPGLAQGRGGSCHAELNPDSRPGSCRLSAGVSRLRRAPARALPRPRALPPLLPQRQAAQANALGARDRGPGVQRGPRPGPAAGPGRMRPGAARELSRVPAPAPSGPGLQSRSRRPAPGRHDFQAAFRLDSLQVRGPGFPGSGVSADPHFNVGGGGRAGACCQATYDPPSRDAASVGPSA